MMIWCDMLQAASSYKTPPAIGNLYSSHFPRYEKRIRQNGMIGGQISTWVLVDEKNFALEGKMFDFVYTANMLWSTAYQNEACSAYTQCVAALLTQARPLIQKGYSLSTYHK